MKEIIIDNINCKIGQNAKENWELLENSKDLYIFFHLSSFPSCFVILENNNINTIKNIEIINKSAIICKNNTKYKNLKNLKIDYTFCNNIFKGENTGEIYYKSNKKVNKIII